MKLTVQKLNPEVKPLVVEALRSGRFPQGFKRLATNEKRCCLGVICEVAADHGIVQRSEISPFGEAGRTFTGYAGPGEDVSEKTLPLSVTKWLGITPTEDSDLVNAVGITNDVSDIVLPWDARMLEYGYPEPATDAPPHRKVVAAASLNDSEVPHSVIADLIEEYL